MPLSSCEICETKHWQILVDWKRLHRNYCTIGHWKREASGNRQTSPPHLPVLGLPIRNPRLYLRHSGAISHHSLRLGGSIWLEKEVLEARLLGGSILLATLRFRRSQLTSRNLNQNDNYRRPTYKACHDINNI